MPYFPPPLSLQALGAQFADPDLEAIAALPTTAWGRGLLTLADDAQGRLVLGAATAAQGVLAESAYQPGDLPSVALTGNWADINNKPATFVPSAHGHPWADITGKPSTFDPSVHGHPWADITGKPSFGTAATQIFESGTWTPVVFGLGTAGVGTYTTQAGTYVRIGNLWILNFRISWTAHTGTGNLSIRGLPLTVASGVGTRGSAAISAANLTLPANTMLSIRGLQGADELFVAAMPVGGGNNAAFALPSTGSIEGSISLTT